MCLGSRIIYQKAFQLAAGTLFLIKFDKTLTLLPGCAYTISYEKGKSTAKNGDLPVCSGLFSDD